jgi:hypothetical protein
VPKIRKLATRSVETSEHFDAEARDYAAKHRSEWGRLERGLRRYADTGWGDIEKVRGVQNDIYRLKVARGLPRVYLLRIGGNRDILIGLEPRKAAYARRVLERIDRRAGAFAEGPAA